MLPSRNPPQSSLMVMPGPIPWILGRFKVQGGCLCWKRADPGRTVVKPSQPQRCRSQPHPGSHPKSCLPWPRCTPPQMLTIFGTCCVPDSLRQDPGGCDSYSLHPGKVGDCICLEIRGCLCDFSHALLWQMRSCTMRLFFLF